MSIGAAAVTSTHTERRIDGRQRGTRANPPRLEPLAYESRCAVLGSGWMPDLVSPFECGSSDSDDGRLHCDDPNLDTPASYSWSLNQTFKDKEMNESVFDRTRLTRTSGERSAPGRGAS